MRLLSVPSIAVAYKARNRLEHHHGLTKIEIIVDF